MRARQVTHHGKPKWLVDYTADGKRARRFFESESKAKIWIRERNKVSAAAGAAVAKLVAEPTGAADIAKALAILEPYKMSILQAAEIAVKAMKQAGAGKTLGEAISSVLEQRKAANRSPRTIATLERTLEKLSNHLGKDTRLGSITTEQIEQWLETFTHAGAVSRHYYRTLASGVFEFAIGRQWIERNPCSTIAAPTNRRGLPKIFTGAQVQTMLASTDDAEIRLYIALGAWAGLRPEAEIEKLDWQYIHIEAGKIDLPEEATKDGRARTVDIMPALKSVLQDHRQLAGPVVPPNFGTLTRFRRWRRGLQFDWIRDGLRHSFGTYHLAAHQHAGKTALQMGHRSNPTMLFEHYARPGVTRSQGRTFFGLEPKTAKKAEVANA